MNFHQRADQILKELDRVFEKMDEHQFECSADLIASEKRIFVTGAGRAGFEASALAMRLMHLGLKAWKTAEPVCPAIEENDLLIAISASGTTASVLSNAQKAKKVHARVLAITTDPESELAKMSDQLLIIPAQSKSSKEKVSIQPMSSLFIQAVCLITDLLIMALMEKLNVNETQMKKNHTNLE